MNLMKKGLFLGTLLMLPIVAFAQELGQVSDLQFLQDLLEFIGGIKGAGTLAIVAGAVQLIMQLLKTEIISKLIPKLTGAKKLLIVSGLTMIGGVMVLMVEGQTIVQSLLHATTLAALQVFANQIFQQFTKKE